MKDFTKYKIILTEIHVFQITRFVLAKKKVLDQVHYNCINIHTQVMMLKYCEAVNLERGKVV